MKWQATNPIRLPLLRDLRKTQGTVPVFLYPALGPIDLLLRVIQNS